MKNITNAAFLTVAILGLASPVFSAEPSREPVVPAGMINMKAVEIRQALGFYAELANVQLVIASDVKRLPGKINVVTTTPLTRSEVIALLEKTFREQVGVVIAKLDDGRMSVTYNDGFTRAAPGKQDPWIVGATNSAAATLPR